jgi:transcription initiation factor TFIIF subunit alpha
MQRQPSNVPPQREYEEYRLKSTAAANVSHNIMILNGTTASIQDFTPPVRLLRDRKYYSDDEDEMDIDQGNRKREPVEAGRGKRKRTRILYLEDEDEIALREQESAPWLLEDFDGQHTFVGRLEGGQTSNYVFFVNQGNEFRVLPASRWYRFNPKPNFQPLTLEEAEAHMTTGRKKEDTSRWLMRDRRSAEASEDEGESPEKVSKLKGLKEQSLRASSSSIGGKIRNRTNNDYEDLDFEDVFDDDDEGQMDLDADQDSNNGAETRKKASTLSNHGKQVRKLMKTLDRANWNEEFEEDEEDPYAVPFY